MREPKFQIGQTVYTAQEYRLGRFTIKEIIIKIKEDTTTIEYSLLAHNNREYVWPEAMILIDFEQAKQIALDNWEKIYANTKKSLEDSTPELFDELVKKAQEKEKLKEQIKA